MTNDKEMQTKMNNKTGLNMPPSTKDTLLIEDRLTYKIEIIMDRYRERTNFKKSQLI